jgi:hypothetical protein
MEIKNKTNTLWFVPNCTQLLLFGEYLIKQLPLFDRDHKAVDLKKPKDLE